MSNKYYVYAYLDPRKTSADPRFIHEPFYIGRGSESRINYHLKEAKKLPDHIPFEMAKSKRINMLKINKIRAIWSAGLEPIIIKLNENLTLDESKLIEISFIDELGRSAFGDGPLTNLTVGGEGRHICHAGRFNPFYGKTHSDEFKTQMSELHSGKEISKEHRESISLKLKGKPKSRACVESRRTYLRKLHNEDPNNDIFQRLGKHNSKTWVITSPTGEQITVTSLRNFCKKNGLNVKTLMTAYNQKRSTRDGWSVELVN